MITVFADYLMIDLIEKENREMNLGIYRAIKKKFHLNMWFYKGWD